jgi:hypothetical protein
MLLRPNPMQMIHICFKPAQNFVDMPLGPPISWLSDSDAVGRERKSGLCKLLLIAGIKESCVDADMKMSGHDCAGHRPYQYPEQQSGNYPGDHETLANSSSAAGARR